MSEQAEALRLGEALAQLRRERGLSQAEAGNRIGMTSQGWGLYESGKRAGLFRPDVQRRLTGALDATVEDLHLLIGGPVTSPARAVAVAGMEARHRGFEGPSVLGKSRLRLDTDDMAPWAFAGVVLEYVEGQWPRRDQGCVLDFDDGQRLVRLFARSDAAEVWVRDAAGDEEAIARARLARVSAVVARLEDG
ncbi:MAG: helix-turn-helix transcriptional regulator [Janthinobacterium lividum]